MGFIDISTRLAKAQLVTFILIAVSNLFAFIAVLTPAWQTADDLDANTRVDSGLWLYCPGAAQCWYIFSDNLINYYEKVDVCRFLLIGDCRKKLLRTPYFFGWHYAVLILMLATLALSTAALVTLAYGYFKPSQKRIATVLLDATLCFAALLFIIALAVFMINAEMLESRYLIGLKQTFEKTYGYSFYLACFGFLIMMFAVFSAVLITTYVFCMPEEIPEGSFKYTADYVANTGIRPGQGYSPYRDYQIMQESGKNSKIYLPPTNRNSIDSPRFGYTYSNTDTIPTRTFLSY